MENYKNGKWASKIISLQKDDGSWGYFHTLSEPKAHKAPTTEQALRRLRILGYTKDDTVIKKALAYMHDCLAGNNALHDRIEKGRDWDNFTKLMLAAWIRKFTRDDILANQVAKKWSTIVYAAFQSGQYDADAYDRAWKEVLKPTHVRITKLDSYYPISLLAGEIDEIGGRDRRNDRKSIF